MNSSLALTMIGLVMVCSVPAAALVLWYRATADTDDGMPPEVKATDLIGPIQGPSLHRHQRRSHTDDRHTFDAIMARVRWDNNVRDLERMVAESDGTPYDPHVNLAAGLLYVGKKYHEVDQ